MGAVSSIFGGKKKPDSRPRVAAEPQPKTTDQASLASTPASAQKRTNTRQRSSQLVSGRPGSATRSGVNVPGRG
jgi:hypothetical protein